MSDVIKIKNKLLLASLHVAMALFLTACTGSSSGDDDDADADAGNLDPNESTDTTMPVENEPPEELPVSTSQCTGTPTPENITDVILATGQSNLIGPDTKVAAEYDAFGRITEFLQPDRPHPYVFAWNVDPNNGNAGVGWEIASLTQSWHDTNPGVGGIAVNNFAFHFAKQVANRASTCRIIGIVMVAEGGKGISHWDTDMPGWNEVRRHTGEALNAIGRGSVDGILWHQGESDWITDGTCYPGDVCVPGQPDFYPQKLYDQIADPNINNPIGTEALINRLRQQWWFEEGKPFIAAETLKAPVNIHLNKLNDDNDFWTATVRGDTASGLGINETDPFENHYSAEGLRELGERYATEYIKMKGY